MRRRDGQQDEFYRIVGETIREARQRAGVRICDLSRETGLSDNAIQSAEMGETCSAWVLAKIAEGLDLTIDDLVPLDAVA